jgi:hypothetical protein
MGSNLKMLNGGAAGKTCYVILMRGIQGQRNSQKEEPLCVAISGQIRVGGSG